MREYGRVHSAFWSSADVQVLSDDAKLLALYLLTCSHGTIAGVCRMPDGYAAEDLKWTSGRVSKGLEELFSKGFANRCETTKWVWIRKFLQWNTPENPNQWKAVWKVVGQIPAQCSWRADFLRLLTSMTGKEPPPEANPCETVCEPFRNLSSIPTATASQHQMVPTEPVERSAPDAVPRGTVDRVFEHWRDVHGHTRATLDDKRRKLIRTALSRHSEADLCQAISGYKNSPHHMGQNDRATVYDDIDVMIRDSKHVEAGLKFYAEPPRTDLSAKTRANVAAIADWKPPELRNAGQ